MFKVKQNYNNVGENWENTDDKKYDDVYNFFKNIHII